MFNLRRNSSIEKRLLKHARKCRAADDLCAIAAEVLKVPITTLAMPKLPPSVSAVSLSNQDQFVILYNPTVTYLSLQLSILHELAHICLCHHDPARMDLFAVISGKTYFTDQQEREAEKLGCRFLEAIIDVRALSPPNSPVGARFEALIG